MYVSILVYTEGLFIK